MSRYLNIRDDREEENDRESEGEATRIHLRFFFFFFPKDVCLFWTNLFCESVFTAPSQETQDTVNKIKIKIIKEKKDSFPLKLLIVS